MTRNPFRVLSRAAAIAWLATGLSVAAPVPSAASEQVSAAWALEQTIHQVRASQGRAPLQPLPQALEQANRVYGLSMLQDLLDRRDCDHDLVQWQGFQRRAKATDPLVPMSEVLACPRATEGWSSAGVVNNWRNSPFHRAILFERDNRSHIGCVVAERQNSMAALCTLWKNGR